MEIRAERPLDVIDAVRKVNALSMPGNRPPRIRSRMAADHTSGNIVLRLNKARIGFPGNVLFTAKDAELRRGERVALIGPNGSGKTTFLRVLLGQLEPLGGEVKLGAGLQIGYFAQAHDSLNGDHTVLEEIIRHRKSMDDEHARSYLAAHLFRGEDVFKPLSALSGGERARLALAILALDGANFLLLDEPTNHLDIGAQEVLQEMLEEFRGTILLVSHDRYLIDRLATQIWELRQGHMAVFHGSYREYVLRQASTRGPEQGRKILLAPRPLVRDNSRETRKREQALTMLEERIRDQELAVQRLSRELQKTAAASNGRAYERIQQISGQIAQAQATLDRLMIEWENLAV